MFLIALFFVSMLGSRFYGMIKPKTGHPPVQKSGALSPGESATPSVNNGADHYFAIVKQTIDGDTILTTTGEKIRYLGIDTPERDEPGSTSATKLNHSFVHGVQLRIEPCKERPKDKHGRTLAFVFAKGKNLSMELLAQGMGRVYADSKCNGHRSKILWQTMIKAYKGRLGIWSDAPENPINTKNAINHLNKTRIVKGTVLDVKRGKNNYYAHLSPDWSTTGFSIRIPFESAAMANKEGIAPYSLAGKEVIIIGLIEKWQYGPSITCYSKWQFLEIK